MNTTNVKDLIDFTDLSIVDKGRKHTSSIMQAEPCNEKKNPISFVIHSGVVKGSGQRSSAINISKNISLCQEPRENISLQMRFECSNNASSHHDPWRNNYSYSHGIANNETRKKNVDLTIKFMNNLHEVSKDYEYEISVYVYCKRDNTFLHYPIFSFKQVRTTNQISAKYQSDNGDNLKGLLSGDDWDSSAIHLCCSIERRNTKKIESLDKKIIQNNIGTMLFETGLYSDTSVVVEGKIFQVHKHILAAKSSVFKAMFSHDMLESNKGIVTINDFHPEVIHALLTFIYTGDTPLLSKIAVELFQTAHRYDIVDLKAQCEEYFLFNLNSKNVMNILYAANLYDLLDLKKSLMEFVRNRESEMVREQSFRQFLRRDLSMNTIIYTLKLCDKYKHGLKEVEIEAFKFVKANNENLVRNKEFMEMFSTHSNLMARMYTFIHKGD